ncbi:hypothetical protein ACOACO_03725 [Nocardioides sp. CPCC 205120]|uniref:hypothetical protein n=1 Tax=Nocardioides sp. CPCC 205120 TaxID=3406462 RepID=UPI003B512E29
METVGITEPLLDRDYQWLGSWFKKHPKTELWAHDAGGPDLTDLAFLRWFHDLNRLRLDLANLTDLNQLDHLPDTLGALDVGRSRREPSLRPLRRFAQLRRLGLERQHRDIDTVRELRQLEDIRLRSLTLDTLDTLGEMNHLRRLEIAFGGTKNITAVQDMSSLRDLELVQIRGFTDLGPAANNEHLGTLSVFGMPHAALPQDWTRARGLRTLTINTMKGVADLRPLTTAPSLVEVNLIAMQHLRPEDLRPLLDVPGLQRVWYGLGSDKKNHQAAAVLGHLAPRQWR